VVDYLKRIRPHVDERQTFMNGLMLSDAEAESCDLGNGCEVIEHLLWEFKQILEDDFNELYALIREHDSWEKWERHPYSPEVLELILNRYRDMEFHNMIQELLNLREEDWEGWLHAVGAQGIDVCKWSPVGLLLDLWVGESKTESAKGRLLKRH
jgi:hypothetical protein